MNYEQFKKRIVLMALMFIIAFSTAAVSVTPADAQGYPHRYGYERRVYRDYYRSPYYRRVYRAPYSHYYRGGYRYNPYYRPYYPYRYPYRYHYPYGGYGRYGRYYRGGYHKTRSNRRAQRLGVETSKGSSPLPTPQILCVHFPHSV